MAAQYCRYCAFCFEADDYRCSNHPRGKEPHWTEEQIKKNKQLQELSTVSPWGCYHGPAVQAKTRRERTRANAS